MRIDRAALENFRNYQRQEARFHPERNVIFGENAQGKTNLLEALACLSRGKSPRVRTDREVIRFGEEAAFLDGEVRSRDRTFHLEIGWFQGRRRSVKINGVGGKTAGDLGSVLMTVLFQPEDLYLIRAGAAERRRFLDTALCQLRPRYAAHLSAYNRCLAQKTRILKDSAETPSLLSALPEFNAQLLRHGAALVHYRAKYAARLEEYAGAFHGECAGGRERLEARYVTCAGEIGPETAVEDIAGGLEAHLRTHEAAELAARQCLSGPHKDDLAVFVNGSEARRYASQGQARTASLALKLAEREICKNAAGEYPVLLLDDVLSELDPMRQEYILNRVGGGQLFLTCCEGDRLPRLLGGQVLKVENGVIANQ